MATPDTNDIVIYRGDTTSLVFTYEDINGDPIDVTGYSAKFQARKDTDASTADIDLSSAGGTITVGTTNGLFTVSISAAITAALDSDDYDYDLQVTDGSSNVRTISRGTITLLKDVTRT